MAFESYLELRHVPGRLRWEVISPLRYRTTDERLIVVPVGFLTDLASVPRLAWRIVPRDHECARRPAALHDYIYTDLTRGYTRAEADRIFYRALLEEGMDKVLAWLMYTAVRIGGRGNWRA